jgi:hypothetical protein
VQDVRAVLEAFLKAWHEGDRAGMLHYATPQAIDNFDNVNSDDPQQLTYELVWSDHCLLGPMASGTCEFLVHKPGPGHALIYSLHYVSTPEGLKLRSTRSCLGVTRAEPAPSRLAIRRSPSP